MVIIVIIISIGWFLSSTFSHWQHIDNFPSEEQIAPISNALQISNNTQFESINYVQVSSSPRTIGAISPKNIEIHGKVLILDYNTKQVDNDTMDRLPDNLTATKSDIGNDKQLTVIYNKFEKTGNGAFDWKTELYFFYWPEKTFVGNAFIDSPSEVEVGANAHNPKYYELAAEFIEDLSNNHLTFLFPIPLFFAP